MITLRSCTSCPAPLSTQRKRPGRQEACPRVERLEQTSSPLFNALTLGKNDNSKLIRYNYIIQDLTDVVCCSCHCSIKILVNRGYVPKQKIRPETRMKGQVSVLPIKGRRGLYNFTLPCDEVLFTKLNLCIRNISPVLTLLIFCRWRMRWRWWGSSGWRKHANLLYQTTTKREIAGITVTWRPCLASLGLLPSWSTPTSVRT